MGEVLIAGTASLLICVFLSPKFISFLRTREFGQHIREEGPQEHHAKAGTPTMGGIIIFTAIAVPFLLLTDLDPRSVGVFGVVACALLGFADDYTKIVKRRSLGLRARTKLVVTVLIAVGLWLIATEWAGLPDTVNLRIIDAQIDLGYLYPVFIYLVLATTSAVNLTDGLDGLAAGCAAITLLSYIAITFTTRQTDLALVAGCLVGASVGFLWFNSFPASIFMGDTGSLGLGGAIAAIAVMTKTEVLLIILGGIFVIEALSVLTQVFSFQTFRKRLFLMAPIHHHFELKAWSETKIILRFWIVAAVCSAIGFTRCISSPWADGAVLRVVSRTACDPFATSVRRSTRSASLPVRSPLASDHMPDREEQPHGVRPASARSSRPSRPARGCATPTSRAPPEAPTATPARSTSAFSATRHPAPTAC